MRRVAHGANADAGGLRLVDGELHGAPRIGVAETAAAIDQCGNRRFPHDGGLGAHVDPAGASAFVVRRHHRDAVRVDAVQVGPAHDLGGADGGRFGHAPGPQDELELACDGSHRTRASCLSWVRCCARLRHNLSTSDPAPDQFGHTIESNGSRCGSELGGGCAALTAPDGARRLRPAGTRGECAVAGDIDIRTERPADLHGLARRRNRVRTRQGRHVRWRARLQGHSLRRLDGRRQPLHAAAQARAVDRCPRGDRLCRPFAAGGRRPAAAGARDGLGAGRHAAGRRGLPDAACLDTCSRYVEASGHGLAARRRLLLRLGQLAALRQHQSRPAQRCRGRGRQSSAEYLRPPRSVEPRRRALRPIRQCRPSRSGAGAGVGA